MFLFNKRTRNIIKFIWAIFAVLIILSMVVTYSGFTMLARTAPTPITTDTVSDVVPNADTINATPDAVAGGVTLIEEQEAETDTAGNPPPPQLNFSL